MPCYPNKASFSLILASSVLLGCPAVADEIGDAIELLQLAMKCPVQNREGDRTIAGRTWKWRESRTARVAGSETELKIEFQKKQVSQKPYAFPICIVNQTLAADFSKIEASLPKPTVIRLTCKGGDKCISEDRIETKYESNCGYYYESCSDRLTDHFKESLGATNLKVCDEGSASDAIAALAVLTKGR